MPKQLAGEIAANFAAFDGSWPKELQAARAESEKYPDKFQESFKQITSIQAWRSSIIGVQIPSEAEAFFFEGQNDLLISHCLARCGSARQALKSLRSAIENFYFSLFYADHPIELLKWKDGRHRISFSELHAYFEDHPALVASGPEKTGLNILKSEYATLSKAVHASATQFRMTQRISEIRLWSNDLATLGKWSTRERSVTTGINLMLLHLFRDELQGTKQLGLRTALALCLSTPQRTYAKASLGISIPNP